MTINSTSNNEAGFMHGLIGGVGLPIAENPTGVMMEAAFADLGLQWRYLLIEAGPEELSDIVSAMKALRFKGGNFTVPHKVEIIPHLDGLAESAKLIGAVNTIRIEDDGRWIGENTDGHGFMMALREEGVDPIGKSVVLLGAGGAARAIGVELVLAGASQVEVVNRTLQRGEGLVQTLEAAGCLHCSLVKWDEVYEVPKLADIVVQATSIGLGAPEARPNVRFDNLASGSIVCDVIPNPPNTQFLKDANECGAKTMDGLSMIVNQAAIALEHWSGKQANREIMREALEKGLGLA